MTEEDIIREDVETLAKAAMLPEVTRALTDCLRIIEGLESFLVSYRWNLPIKEDAFVMLENKTCVVARAKEIAAKAREI